MKSSANYKKTAIALMVLSTFSAVARGRRGRL